MRNFDVIVCGAGPAGSVASIQLARKGISVLMLDQKKFPRDKICGDQLPPSGMELLLEMDIIEREYFESQNIVNQAAITGPFGTEINFQFDVLSEKSKPCIIPREELDYKLFQKAINSNVVFQKAKLINIEYRDDGLHVHTQTDDGMEKLECKALVAADGANSTISRILGNLPGIKRGIAIRSYVEGIACNPNKIEGYFTKHLQNGYVWIFPLSNSKANIGLGMDMNAYKKQKFSLKKHLLDFIDQDEIKARLTSDFKIKSIKAWPLNIGPPDWKNLAKDRILFTGDAASLINPVAGGGVVNAILSGKIAAQVLTEQLKANRLDSSALSHYHRRLKRIIGKELNMSRLLSKFLAHSPKNIEFLLKLALKSEIPYKLMNMIFTDIKLTLIK